MDKVNISEFPQLLEAVLVWTGWRRSVMPLRDDSLLADHFGSDIAAKLRPVIKSLENEFYSSNARYVAADLQEMGRMAAEEFKKKHPQIPDEIVQAFTWCYTYDYK